MNFVGFCSHLSDSRKACRKYTPQSYIQLPCTSKTPDSVWYFSTTTAKIARESGKKHTTFFFSKVYSTGEARIIKESYIKIIIIIIKRMTCFCKEQIWQRRDTDGIRVIMVCSAVSMSLTFQKCWGKLQGHPDVSI